MVWIALCLLLIGLDQLVKWMVVAWVAPRVTVPIIQNIFHLTYVENRGAAFGMLQGQMVFFTIVVVGACAAIGYYFYKKTTKEQTLLRFSLVLILAGAMGNYIDRLTRGFVVDMFDFRLINFYVFNLADTWITVGAVLLFIYFIFIEGKGKQAALHEN